MRMLVALYLTICAVLTVESWLPWVLTVVN